MEEEYVEAPAEEEVYAEAYEEEGAMVDEGAAVEGFGEGDEVFEDWGQEAGQESSDYSAGFEFTTSSELDEGTHSEEGSFYEDQSEDPSLYEEPSGTEEGDVVADEVEYDGEGGGGIGIEELKEQMGDQPWVLEVEERVQSIYTYMQATKTAVPSNSRIGKASPLPVAETTPTPEKTTSHSDSSSNLLAEAREARQRQAETLKAVGGGSPRTKKRGFTFFKKKGGIQGPCANPRASIIIRTSPVTNKIQVNFKYDWEDGDDIMSQFKLDAKLGAGPHGKVYRAKHVDTGFVLAVKGVPLMAPNKEEELAKRESVHSVMGRFSHENLVAYYGSGIQRGSLFIFLEHCPSGSLGDILRLMHGGLNEVDALHILHDVLTGLHYLHGKNEPHRDLKSNNIMVKGSKVKLADYCIANYFKTVNSKGFEETDTLYNEWPAPELSNGSAFQLKSDVWAIGLLLVEMINGKSKKGYKGTPSFNKNRKVSKHLMDFLQKCLHPDPFKRPSVKDLLYHPIFNVRPANHDLAKSLRVSTLKVQKNVDRSRFTAQGGSVIVRPDAINHNNNNAERNVSGRSLSLRTKRQSSSGNIASSEQSILQQLKQQQPPPQQPKPQPQQQPKPQPQQQPEKEKPTADSPADESYEVVALQAHKGKHKMELSFPKGAVIIVSKEDEDGRSFGKYGKKTGWFPSYYVHRNVESKPRPQRGGRNTVLKPTHIVAPSTSPRGSSTSAATSTGSQDTSGPQRKTDPPIPVTQEPVKSEERHKSEILMSSTHVPTTATDTRFAGAADSSVFTTSVIGATYWAYKGSDEVSEEIEEGAEEVESDEEAKKEEEEAKPAAAPKGARFGVPMMGIDVQQVAMMAKLRQQAKVRGAEGGV